MFVDSSAAKKTNHARTMRVRQRQCDANRVQQAEARGDNGVPDMQMRTVAVGSAQAVSVSTNPARRKPRTKRKMRLCSGGVDATCAKARQKSGARCRGTVTAWQCGGVCEAGACVRCAGSEVNRVRRQVKPNAAGARDAGSVANGPVVCAAVLCSAR